VNEKEHQLELFYRCHKGKANKSILKKFFMRGWNAELNIGYSVNISNMLVEGFVVGREKYDRKQVKRVLIRK